MSIREAAEFDALSMLYGLLPANWLTLHSVISVVAVLIYVVTARLVPQRRHPASAIAWVLFILLVPYLALPAFLMFGTRKRTQLNPSSESLSLSSVEGSAVSWSVQTIAALRQPPPAGYHDFRLHANGNEALASLWEVLDGAQRSIDVCTFILGRDEIGESVVARLCAKARAGVRVRLLLDGVGSLMAGRPRLQEIRAAGGEFTLFVPLLHARLSVRSNLRDHRKLLLTDIGHDDARLWCGGRNLAAEYFLGDARRTAWHDLSFDLRGPLVAQASTLFEHDWAFARGTPPPRMPATPAALLSPAAASAQLVASGPDQVDDTVYSLLVTAAFRAERRIVLVTPYFVPDSGLLQALCLAARRGVVVELLLPAKSNHPMSDVARHRALRALADAGGYIKLAPHMLHAKLAVIDYVLALAGSANFDSRSLFLNYELMFAFHDSATVGRFADWFEDEQQGASTYVATRPGVLRDMAEGAVLWLGFEL